MGPGVPDEATKNSGGAGRSDNMIAGDLVQKFRPIGADKSAQACRVDLAAQVGHAGASATDESGLLTGTGVARAISKRPST